VRTQDGEIAIRKTGNADPVWLNSTDHPLLIVDVWEHAYYLDYQNRRAEYLDKIISIINWSFAESRFGAAKFYGDLARQER
jgi:Fe-Mn family superoxide dismutase